MEHPMMKEQREAHARKVEELEKALLPVRERVRRDWLRLRHAIDALREEKKTMRGNARYWAKRDKGLLEQSDFVRIHTEPLLPTSSGERCAVVTRSSYLARINGGGQAAHKTRFCNWMITYEQRVQTRDGVKPLRRFTLPALSANREWPDFMRTNFVHFYVPADNPQGISQPPAGWGVKFEGHPVFMEVIEELEHIANPNPIVLRRHVVDTLRQFVPNAVEMLEGVRVLDEDVSLPANDLEDEQGPPGLDFF